MTVIVWDGRTLAADRQATSGELPRAVTKIRRHGDILMAMAGDPSYGSAIMDWIVKGMKPKEFPNIPDGHNADVWVVNKNGTVAKFESTPYPLKFEDETFACGSGRDLAIMAMHYGADAKAAVEAACEYNVYCGMGVDTLTFDD